MKSIQHKFTMQAKCMCEVVVTNCYPMKCIWLYGLRFPSVLNCPSIVVVLVCGDVEGYFNCSVLLVCFIFSALLILSMPHLHSAIAPPSSPHIGASNGRVHVQYEWKFKREFGWNVWVCVLYSSTHRQLQPSLAEIFHPKWGKSYFKPGLAESVCNAWRLFRSTSIDTAR